MNSIKFSNRTVFIVIYSFIGLSVVIFLSQAGLAKHLNDWQIIPRPEPYTELFFTNEQQLPTSASVGDKQNLSFIIHNHEHQIIIYHYRLIAMSADDNIERQLGEGTAMLGHDQSWTGDPIITLPPLGKRIAVKVALHYQGLSFGNSTPSLQSQSIHYWVNITDALGLNQETYRKSPRVLLPAVSHAPVAIALWLDRSPPLVSPVGSKQGFLIRGSLDHDKSAHQLLSNIDASVDPNGKKHAST